MYATEKGQSTFEYIQGTKIRDLIVFGLKFLRKNSRSAFPLMDLLVVKSGNVRWHIPSGSLRFRLYGFFVQEVKLLGETPGQGNVGSGCTSHTIRSVPNEVRERNGRRTT